MSILIGPRRVPRPSIMLASKQIIYRAAFGWRHQRSKGVSDAGSEASQTEASERLRAAIGRLSRRLRPTVAGTGLTPSQISVLFTVVRLGPIGLSELALMESLNATMLSRITAQLCDAGLIVRERRPR